MISTRRRPLDGLKRLLRSLRRAPERLLHPWRRRKAIAALRTVPPPETVLVVCHGNICRSPYGAAKLRGLLHADGVHGVRVDSAGFIGPHREPPPEAIAVAGTRGFDLRRHRSRVITPESARGSGLVIVMEPGQAGAVRDRFGLPRSRILVLGDLDPGPILTRAIRDPVLQPRAVFEESYDRIDRCLDALVHTAWTRLPGGARDGQDGGDGGTGRPVRDQR